MGISGQGLGERLLCGDGPARLCSALARRNPSQRCQADVQQIRKLCCPEIDGEWHCGAAEKPGSGVAWGSVTGPLRLDMKSPADRRCKASGLEVQAIRSLQHAFLGNNLRRSHGKGTPRKVPCQCARHNKRTQVLQPHPTYPRVQNKQRPMHPPVHHGNQGIPRPRLTMSPQA